MPKPFSVAFARDVAAPMRDGVILYADLYCPAAPDRYPVILQRTPSNKAAAIGASAFALRATGVQELKKSC
jgi:predicted acyl esterase